ncbi:GroES-like protein [Basidiobolus meristosporus CBS 931.73]|uniref:alcohol dehydrogenase n=1 Tax=Basidiobolus meristosporus CBS 931.73 TaxID=1314790 RepID=A0A1Y1ZAP2_9FUNG|nr:GroES-like protein [Basidiobolus meristosporus CBS 931.73]ORY06863.1 GroES-like protein [Basidiobolus meristosporus CBS 931.73]ORY06864.1 GroES-like protein [Basidiobolus meristosporus CBS 931.73]ORY06865.1 GroES-like protein [Basidiobolus meristosporus CBS 931.73]|eukprot:ORY06861.1 GroES-like protein [Basidiobolus meristosporus CBS 931.73]
MCQIPKTQKAAVIESHDKPVEIQTIPVPTPGPDDVLVKIEYTGVCHTDLHAAEGDWPIPTKLPLVGGHEGAGKVVALGSNVKDLKIGDSVGVVWLHSACMTCEYCIQGRETVCPNQHMSGYSVDGSFQEYCVARASHVARIPDNLPLIEAAPILCAGVTVYKGLKETEVRSGQFVTIVGAGGGLGHLAVQYAKAMGMNVVAVDTGDDKRKLCVEELGADYFVDFMKDDVVATVKEVTGGGSHGVLLLSPAEKPFQQAVDYTRRWGTVACIALPAGAKGTFPVFDLVLQRLTIRGSIVGNRQDLAEALDFAARGKVRCHYKVMDLEKIPQIYEDMHAGKIAGRIILDLHNH